MFRLLGFPAFTVPRDVRDRIAFRGGGCLLGGGMAQELAPELAPEVRGLGGDGLVRLRPA